MANARYRDGDEVLLAHPDDLIEELRRGRLRDTTPIQHDPWTGAEFRPARTIPELAEALQAPEARLCATLRGPARVWAMPALLVALSVGFVVQAILGLPAFLQGDVLGTAVMRGGAMGLGPTLLDGHWWSPWTAEFLHVGPGHLLGNMPMIAYFGYRVERALGASSMAFVVAMSALFGALFVVPLSTLPVVGSSVIAYGLWGAQMAIGFRYDGALPAERRGNYGMGVVVFFLPMLAMSIYTARGVSLLGHFGGLAGGILATWLARPSTMGGTGMWPRAGVAAVAPMVLAAVGAQVPLWGWSTQSWPDRGFAVELPSFFAKEARVAGMYGWIAHDFDTSGVFAMTYVRSEPGLGTPEELAADWGDGATVIGTTQEGRDRVVSLAVGDTTVNVHERERGLYLLRFGEMLGPGAGAGRKAVHARMIASVQMLDRPTMIEARTAFEKAPSDPRAMLDYAGQLEMNGEAAKADELYAKLEALGYTTQADRGRVRLRAFYPEVGGEDQVRGWMAAHEEDNTIQFFGARVLARTGDCAAAVASLTKVADTLRDRDLRTLQADLERCQAR